MLKQFAEHYRPTDEAFKELWQDAVFSFDANVLLDIYRFSLQSRNELLKLMKEYRERIWIAHQSAYEFHANRLTVIDEVHKTSDSLLQGIQELLKVLNDDCKQHPYLTAELVAEIKPNLEAGLAKVMAAKDGHPDFIANDLLGNQIAEILDGRVGDPYPPERLSVVFDEIDKRYAEQIPPGYLDLKKKSKERARGDAIVWFQMMDYAKANKKSIIFVTRDNKDDWWLRHGGKTLQPRPELRREFSKKTNQEFYAYTTFRFIEVAKDNLGNTVSDAFIAEAKQLADNVLQDWSSAMLESANVSGSYPSETFRIEPLRLLERSRPEHRERQLLLHERFLCRKNVRRLRIEIEEVKNEMTRLSNASGEVLASDFDHFNSLRSKEMALRIELMKAREDEKNADIRLSSLSSIRVTGQLSKER